MAFNGLFNFSRDENENARVIASGTRARKIALWATLATALLALAPARAAETPVPFRGLDEAIFVEGDPEIHYIGDASAPDSELVLVFTNSAADAVNKLRSTLQFEARVLVVGGGGAGGYGTSNANGPGAGGGGGAVKELANVAYDAATYSMVIGRGGAQTTSGSGENGYPTSFTTPSETITMLGGGGGGAKGVGKGGETVATGGGGSGTSNPGGVGALGEGHKGGNAGHNRYPGGGGGAGGPGSDGGASTSGRCGDGGKGVESDITGEWLGYGGGGGGGFAYSADDDREKVGRGVDGGGEGARRYTPAENGLFARGGGGGGGSRDDDDSVLGGAGGSGVVIIRITWIKPELTWYPIDVEAGGNKSTIFVANIAATNWLDNGDLVITYATGSGGLSFKDPKGRPEYADLSPVWANARVLLVGGGGGGGCINERRFGAGGGGGAGGVVERKGLVFDNSAEFTVSVGAGGAGGAANEEAGKNGAPSTLKRNGINVVDEALGGGGGGAHDAGLDGGSGGGGSSAGTGGAGLQGNKGGDGKDVVYVAGGGGGAGGAGYDAVLIDGARKAGAGGAGIENDITGVDKLYAAGGGGSFVNQEDKSYPGPGGAGGSGIGGNGAGVENNEFVAATDGADGTGSGGGGGVSYAGAVEALGEAAGRGGDGVVIIRLSAFVVKGVKVPEAQGPFTYDGTVKEGVKSHFSYSIVTNADDYRTWPVGVNADNYTVTVKIAEDAPWEWDDATGGRGTRTVAWRIRQLAVDVPEVNATPARADYFVFGNGKSGNLLDEEPKLAIDGDKYLLKERDPSVYPGETCATANAAGTELPYCTLTGHRETNAGEYHFTATLVTLTDRSGVEIAVTNFIWRTPVSMAPQRVDWKIDQAANEVTDLKVGHWQEGTAPKAPSCGWRWQNVMENKHPEHYPNQDKVTYQWRLKDGGTWSEAKTVFEPPTDAGVYELRAYICKDSNHTPGNWKEAESIIRFFIWRHPSKTLSDYVNIEMTGCDTDILEDSALTDFPMLVRLKEPVRDATGAIVDGLPGFHYADVGRNGLELRFISLANKNEYTQPDTNRASQATDTLLPFEIDTWDPSGESLVWVKVPKAYYHAKFRMYWRMRRGATLLDDIESSETWANGYIGVWHFKQDESGTVSLVDSTANHLVITGECTSVDARFSKGVLATTAISMAGTMRTLGLTDDKFSYSAWVTVQNYSSGQNIFCGNKGGKGYTTNPGWGFFLNNNKGNLGISANSTWTGSNISTDMSTNWRHLGFISPGLAERSGYYEGVKKSAGNSKTTVVNDSPITVALKGYATDEVRLSSVTRGDKWVKAEYDSVNNAKYCTFGLVNQLQADESRAWVNWWSVEPWSAARGVAGTEDGRYWRQPPKTPILYPNVVTNSYFGRLAQVYNTGITKISVGSVFATYVKMPNSEQVVFPTELGPYSITFTMADMETGTESYPGKHILYDGDRKVDIEIVEDKPQPIDPGGASAITASGRVLIANDQNVSDPTNGVAGQAYSSANWEHGGEMPPDLGVNLWGGSYHRLYHYEPQPDETVVTNLLWELNDVYIGNMMTNDDTVADAQALSNMWNELPWYPTNRSDVGQMVMRNVEGASVVSRLYPDGIGTVYFDAVNVGTAQDYFTRGSDFKLVVEVTTNLADGADWEPLELTPIRFNGYSVPAELLPRSELDCLEAANGGNLDRNRFQFWRVYAVVNRQEPLRFRIRRTSTLARVPAEGEDPVANPDDPNGFILIDNVIASWPAPVPTMRPGGSYDKTLRGKQVLGQEGGVSGGYPAAGDSLYAVGVLDDNSTNMVTSARLHYRWRYLNMQFDPAQEGANSWRTAYLSLTNAASATVSTLQYRNAVGDLEYWYDLTACVPFYEYVDYSGQNYESPTAGYTEQPPKNITSCSQSGIYPSGGTNWFVRLREGHSPIRRMTLRTSLGDVEMELLADRVWRGYVKTLDAQSAGLRFRIEPQTWEKPGDRSVPIVTNFWYVTDEISRLPTSAALQVGTTNDWARVPCDATTGYLTFQVDEGTMSVSIVHGDYQDFNLWDDAKSDDIFMGNASDLGKRGVSPKKREFTEDFVYQRGPLAPVLPWTETPSVSTNWTETFEAGAAQEYPDYTPFGSSTTLGGWTTGPGMYIYAWYRHSGKIPTSGGYVQRALQMEGCGKGWIQFPVTLSEDYRPRGVGTISFTTRLGQFIEPLDDASYADPFDPETAVRTDYTFLTLAAFDTLENKGFAGNASLSLFGYYNDRVGMYELRYEQLNASVSGSTVTGPANNSQRLSLYRWKAVRGQGLVRTTIKEQPISVAWVPTKGETGKYLPLYLSCWQEGDVTVVKGGVWDQDKNGVNYNAAIPGGVSGKKFYSIVYRDNTKDRLAAGTYGVLSANCDGVFLRPHLCEHVATGKTSLKDGAVDVEDRAESFSYLASCEDDIWDSCDEKAMALGLAPWVLTPGRMKVFHKDAYLWGVKNDEETTQTVTVQVKPRGQGKAWETVTNIVVSGFGAAGKEGADHAVRLDRTQDLDLRLQVGGSLTDPRTDVVIDSLQVTQWRGCAYGDHPDTDLFVAPDDGWGWMTNFTFSSAWVKNTEKDGITKATVLLSPKRTAGWDQTAKACAIRSPLMDGMGDPPRGIGLGLISFSYCNAQPNAKLLVQIATNNVQSSALGYDTYDMAKWTTVSNIDFSAMSAKDRRSGRVAIYLGLHGVKGLMRICADPTVVQAVSATDYLDADRYGEVEISHVYCRDEPAIDLTAWTGWNMQTTDHAERQFLTDNLMFESANGLSLGLNRSTDENVEDDPETYKRQMPYVQTPAFASNTVGEVTFRARQYELYGQNQYAEVALYGADFRPGTTDLEWHCSAADQPIARFVISNTTYTTYTYKTKPGEGYKAFRLGVTGIKDVDYETRGPKPTQGENPVRVLIDEVLVSEAVRPEIGFKSIWPVRSQLTTSLKVEGADRREEQPIMGDAWSVQAEIVVRLLPEELDLKTPGHEPRVFFHWFCGDSPWGYAAWKDRAVDGKTCGAAELKRVDGEEMVFKGSYVDAPGAVVMAEPATATYTYRVYQYAAEVVYWDVNGNCITGVLNQAEWKRPEWYAPLDLNAKHGGSAEGGPFAAYNILESASPGRVWINETNLFDGRDNSTYKYTAADRQYIEIAVPETQSLESWKLYVVNNNLTTNLLCVFGMSGVAKSKTVNATNHYAFLTVQSPAAKRAGTLDASKGEVDGTWNTFGGSDKNGELDQTHPIGLRLLRPSGIVAQEIGLEGTNVYASSGWSESYSLKRQVEKMNATDAEKLWYPVGNEYTGTPSTSHGVTNLDFAAARVSAIIPEEMWKNGVKTPGRVNDGQVIPEGYAIYPSGDMVLVNAQVIGPHILQTVGDVTNSTMAVLVATAKDGDGTNITYSLDSPWYEIGEIRENGVVKAAGKGNGFVFAAGKGSSDSVVTVTATARPRSDLRERYGLTPENPYTDAVLAWLEGGRTLKGAFAYPGSIELPSLHDLADNFVTNLTLTETYWFDIDPTGSNWCYRAGTCNPAEETYRHLPGDVVKTNVRIGVYMVITNRSETGMQAGLNWAPYVLRSKVPGADSQQYARGETNKWDSVNFKITADVLNGMPLRQKWVPLRYFIFTEGSFDANCRSTIEIPHPFSADSFSVNYGWRAYSANPEKWTIVYSWSIDSRIAPVAVETLAPTNAITW